MANCSNREENYFSSQDQESYSQIGPRRRVFKWREQSQSQSQSHIHSRNRDVIVIGNEHAAPVGKKYGELVPKKKPLISKDHERAFFDSADWALCKQGAGMNQISATAVETLRPKLQRTPHQQLPPRRPACTSGRDSMGQ